jgi:hypothetical protein
MHPLVIAIIVNVLMFVGIFSRMLPSQALMSAIPDQSQRGSFSVVNASLQQLSGGLGSVLAAAIISQQPDGSRLCRRHNDDHHAGDDVFCAEIGGGAGGEERGVRDFGPISHPAAAMRRSRSG